MLGFLFVLLPKSVTDGEISTLLFHPAALDFVLAVKGKQHLNPPFI